LVGDGGGDKRYRTVLSFDCANMSLAVCCMTYDTHAHRLVQEKLASLSDPTLDPSVVYEKIMEIDALNRQCVVIHFIKLINVLDGIRYETVSRAIKLKEHLTALDTQLPDLDLVLIEYQMSLNDKSRAVSSQILYHYTGVAECQIVGPSMKNTIQFANLPDLSLSRWLDHYAKSYDANKRQCKENFLFWLKIYGKTDLIDGIASRNLDDVADAFMQAVAWIRIRIIKQ
jgi:hypothetical protein